MPDNLTIYESEEVEIPGLDEFCDWADLEWGAVLPSPSPVEPLLNLNDAVAAAVKLKKDCDDLKARMINRSTSVFNEIIHDDAIVEHKIRALQESVQTVKEMARPTAGLQQELTRIRQYEQNHKVTSKVAGAFRDARVAFEQLETMTEALVNKFVNGAEFYQALPLPPNPGQQGKVKPQQQLNKAMCGAIELQCDDITKKCEADASRLRQLKDTKALTVVHINEVRQRIQSVDSPYLKHAGDYLAGFAGRTEDCYIAASAAHEDASAAVLKLATEFMVYETMVNVVSSNPGIGEVAEFILLCESVHQGQLELQQKLSFCTDQCRFAIDPAQMDAFIEEHKELTRDLNEAVNMGIQELLSKQDSVLNCDEGKTFKKEIEAAIAQVQSVDLKASYSTYTTARDRQIELIKAAMKTSSPLIKEAKRITASFESIVALAGDGGKFADWNPDGEAFGKISTQVDQLMKNAAIVKAVQFDPGQGEPYPVTGECTNAINAMCDARQEAYNNLKKFITQLSENDQISYLQQVVDDCEKVLQFALAGDIDRAYSWWPTILRRVDTFETRFEGMRLAPAVDKLLNQYHEYRGKIANAGSEREDRLQAEAEYGVGTARLVRRLREVSDDLKFTILKCDNVTKSLTDNFGNSDLRGKAGLDSIKALNVDRLTDGLNAARELIGPNTKKLESYERHMPWGTEDLKTGREICLRIEGLIKECESKCQESLDLYQTIRTHYEVQVGQDTPADYEFEEFDDQLLSVMTTMAGCLETLENYLAKTGLVDQLPTRLLLISIELPSCEKMLAEIEHEMNVYADSRGRLDFVNPVFEKLETAKVMLEDLKTQAAKAGILKNDDANEEIPETNGIDFSDDDSDIDNSEDSSSALGSDDNVSQTRHRRSAISQSSSSDSESNDTGSVLPDPPAPVLSDPLPSVEELVTSFRDLKAAMGNDRQQLAKLNDDDPQEQDRTTFAKLAGNERHHRELIRDLAGEVRALEEAGLSTDHDRLLNLHLNAVQKDHDLLVTAIDKSSSIFGYEQSQEADPLLSSEPEQEEIPHEPSMAESAPALESTDPVDDSNADESQEQPQILPAEADQASHLSHIQLTAAYYKKNKGKFVDIPGAVTARLKKYETVKKEFDAAKSVMEKQELLPGLQKRLRRINEIALEVREGVKDTFNKTSRKLLGDIADKAAAELERVTTFMAQQEELLRTSPEAAITELSKQPPVVSPQLFEMLSEDERDVIRSERRTELSTNGTLDKFAELIAAIGTADDPHVAKSGADALAKLVNKMDDTTFEALISGQSYSPVGMDYLLRALTKEKAAIAAKQLVASNKSEIVEKLINTMLDNEVRECDDMTTFMRAGGAANAVLNEYIRLMAADYFQRGLNGPVSAVTSLNVTDDQALLSVKKISKDQQPSQEVVTRLNKMIGDTVDQMTQYPAPNELARVMTMLYDKTLARFQQDADASDPNAKSPESRATELVGGFIMLRNFSPGLQMATSKLKSEALTNSKEKNLSPDEQKRRFAEVKLRKQQHEVSTIIAKLLQAVSNKKIGNDAVKKAFPHIVTKSDADGGGPSELVKKLDDYFEQVVQQGRNAPLAEIERLEKERDVVPSIDTPAAVVTIKDLTPENWQKFVSQLDNRNRRRHQNVIATIGGLLDSVADQQNALSDFILRIDAVEKLKVALERLAQQLGTFVTDDANFDLHIEKMKIAIKAVRKKFNDAVMSMTSKSLWQIPSGKALLKQWAEKNFSSESYDAIDEAGRIGAGDVAAIANLFHGNVSDLNLSSTMNKTFTKAIEQWRQVVDDKSAQEEAAKKVLVLWKKVLDELHKLLQQAIDENRLKYII